MVVALTLMLSSLAQTSTASGSAQGFQPLPSLEISAPKDVASVQALSAALDALGEKVTACVKAGQASGTCQCRYPQDLLLLRKRYESVTREHPDWKDQLLSYQYVNKEGRNISGVLAMQTLRRQLDALKCE